MRSLAWSSRVSPARTLLGQQGWLPCPLEASQAWNSTRDLPALHLHPAQSTGVCANTWAGYTSDVRAAAATPHSLSCTSSFASSSAEARSCWNCGAADLPAFCFFCSSCHAVQPVLADDRIYEAFSIAQETFDVDVKQLDRTFRQLQSQLHPDKFSAASSEEQEHAADQSAFVNGAYRTLKDPLARARFLLSQRGRSDGQGGEGTIEDPELLMVVMETREQIEEAESEADLQQLQQDNAAKQSDCIASLAAAFAKDDLDAAEQVVTQLRYLTTAGEAITKKL